MQKKKDTYISTTFLNKINNYNMLFTSE